MRRLSHIGKEHDQLGPGGNTKVHASGKNPSFIRCIFLSDKKIKEKLISKHQSNKFGNYFKKLL